MPTNTSKFNLVKPLKSEKYNVDVFNGNADIIDSQIYSKTEVDTALNGKVDKLMATNLITNGDFSNGTTGWSAFNGVQTVSNGIYTNTGNGTNRFVFTEQNLPILNARYYVKIKFRVTNSSASSIFVHMLGNTIS